jgi:hypothetical protein
MSHLQNLEVILKENLIFLRAGNDIKRLHLDLFRSISILLDFDVVFSGNP